MSFRMLSLYLFFTLENGFTKIIQDFYSKTIKQMIKLV